MKLKVLKLTLLIIILAEEIRSVNKLKIKLLEIKNKITKLETDVNEIQRNYQSH